MWRISKKTSKAYSHSVTSIKTNMQVHKYAHTYADTQADVGSYILGENLSVSDLTFSMLCMLKQEGD